MSYRDDGYVTINSISDLMNWWEKRSSDHNHWVEVNDRATAFYMDDIEGPIMLPSIVPFNILSDVRLKIVWDS